MALFEVVGFGLFEHLVVLDGFDVVGEDFDGIHEVVGDVGQNRVDVVVFFLFEFLVFEGF